MSKLGSILTLLCLLDLLGTQLGILFYNIGESGIILSYFFTKWGVAGLIFGKVFIVGPLILVMELSPELSKNMTPQALELWYKLGILAFVLIFVNRTMYVNGIAV